MSVTVILATLTLISLGLLMWQFIVAWRFPLHRRVAAGSFFPPMTILKPLKDLDEHTADCLRSWLTQNFRGEVQVLFGVAEEGDPVCHLVRDLLKNFPAADAELVITAEFLGPNAKVSTLVQLMRRAKHEIICVSDADVHVPADFLENAVAPLSNSAIGLVNCFYQLANPMTLAMRWEAIAINADFWSQVLQSNSLKRQEFALGAVMITRREQLAEIGGFESLLDYLADDFHLGRKIARTGKRIELSPVVVECRDKPKTFKEVWKHQLRWARTIRASQPGPYFFSILNNVTLWAVLLITSAAIERFQLWNAAAFGFVAVGLRCLVAALLQMWLAQRRDVLGYWWLTPVKDLLGAALWAASFLGNSIEWGGRRFRLGRDGRLVRSPESGHDVRPRTS